MDAPGCKTPEMEVVPRPDLDHVKWGVEKTCDYLREEGLEQFVPMFRDKGIEGKQLRHLGHADLEKIGVKRFGDRLWILHSLEKLWHMESQSNKIFNDPIHGSVELHPLLVKIIDTPQFQRLRNIKQLGATYLVFPGASHNRFEHSIGVCYLAGRLVQALKDRQPELKITPRDVLCVQVAGLCHDLGHGPFSHMFDNMFIPEARSRQKKKAEDENARSREEVEAEDENATRSREEVEAEDENATRSREEVEAEDENATRSREEVEAEEDKWTHEEASVEMFDHLVEENKLWSIMKKFGLKLPKDQNFIKELIYGPLKPKHVTEAQDETESEDEMESEDETRDKNPQDEKWPYQGRKQDKSFLYDIVANKRNGIDVDKWDYFARDCHHLGIQNNFDYQRFIAFARVCDVDGEKQICIRDKEVSSIYDLYHTRRSLHLKACQHRVCNVIEIMISEAFLEADEHIKIICSRKKKPSTAISNRESSQEEDEDCSCGKTYTISIAIKHMPAYTNLTDHVFDQILKSSDPKVAKGKKILEKIVHRRLYKFVGQTEPYEPIDNTPELRKSLKRELADQEVHPDPNVTLEKDDFVVDILSIDHRIKDEHPTKKKKVNPLFNVAVYSKSDVNTAKEIDEEKMSKLLPDSLAEQQIRIFHKKSDNDKHLEVAKKKFEKWMEIAPPPNRPQQDNSEGDCDEEQPQTDQ